MSATGSPSESSLHGAPRRPAPLGGPPAGSPRSPAVPSGASAAAPPPPSGAAGGAADSASAPAAVSEVRTARPALTSPTRRPPTVKASTPPEAGAPPCTPAPVGVVVGEVSPTQRSHQLGHPPQHPPRPSAAPDTLPVQPHRAAAPEAASAPPLASVSTRGASSAAHAEGTPPPSAGRAVLDTASLPATAPLQRKLQLLHMRQRSPCSAPAAASSMVPAATSDVATSPVRHSAEAATSPMHTGAAPQCHGLAPAPLSSPMRPSESLAAAQESLSHAGTEGAAVSWRPSGSATASLGRCVSLRAAAEARAARCREQFLLMQPPLPPPLSGADPVAEFTTRALLWDGRGAPPPPIHPPPEVLHSAPPPPPPPPGYPLSPGRQVRPAAEHAAAAPPAGNAQPPQRRALQLIARCSAADGGSGARSLRLIARASAGGGPNLLPVAPGPAAAPARAPGPAAAPARAPPPAGPDPALLQNCVDAAVKRRGEDLAAVLAAAFADLPSRMCAAAAARQKAARRVCEAGAQTDAGPMPPGDVLTPQRAAARARSTAPRVVAAASGFRPAIDAGLQTSPPRSSPLREALASPPTTHPEFGVDIQRAVDAALRVREAAWAEEREKLMRAVQRLSAEPRAAPQAPPASGASAPGPAPFPCGRASPAPPPSPPPLGAPAAAPKLCSPPRHRPLGDAAARTLEELRGTPAAGMALSAPPLAPLRPSSWGDESLLPPQRPSGGGAGCGSQPCAAPAPLSPPVAAPPQQSRNAMAAPLRRVSELIGPPPPPSPGGDSPRCPPPAPPPLGVCPPPPPPPLPCFQRDDTPREHRDPRAPSCAAAAPCGGPPALRESELLRRRVQQLKRELEEVERAGASQQWSQKMAAPLPPRRASSASSGSAGAGGGAGPPRASSAARGLRGLRAALGQEQHPPLPY
eukprot:TRINITY_DN6480_c0_g1_i5.p1 TRINITY_DN6480_c0_g1~~TRINITY_DN6480_c0_g1_i5.p1  ORF type:complete len:1019 (+),score=124.47 TRINITY_DN6480_c0_g1_i5:299-3058(+)